MPFNAWCSPSPSYPFLCNQIEGVECIRGGSLSLNRKNVLVAISVIIAVGMITVIISMCLIVFGTVTNLSRFNSAVSPKFQKESNLMKKTLARQAMMYIFAFFIIWMPSIVMMFIPNNFVFAMQVLILPLQGFFNTLLFVSHKIYNIRQNDNNLTVWKALYFVVISPVNASEFRLYGVSKVDLDLIRKENRGNEHSHKESVEEVIIAGQVGNTTVISNDAKQINQMSSGREINYSDFSIDKHEEVSFMLEMFHKNKPEDGHQSNVTSLHPPRSEEEERGMVGIQERSEDSSSDGLSFLQLSFSQQSEDDLSGFSSTPPTKCFLLHNTIR
jgi:hypothetical protein